MIVVIDSGCVEHFFSYRCSWSHCLVSVSNSVTVYISLTRAADIVFALGFFFRQCYHLKLTLFAALLHLLCLTITRYCVSEKPGRAKLAVVFETVGAMDLLLMSCNKATGVEVKTKRSPSGDDCE